MPLPFLLPLALGMAGSAAVGWGGHKLAKARRLNEVERDIYDMDPARYRQDLSEVEKLTGKKLSGEDAARAVLDYRTSPKSELGREYAMAKRFTLGDSPDANFRVDLIDLGGDVATGFGMGGLAKAGVKSLAKFAIEPGLGSLVKRGLMEAAESTMGQGISHGAVRGVEALGGGELLQTGAGLLGGYAGSLGAHAIPSGIRAYPRAGLGKAVADAVPTTSSTASSVPASAPELPAPTPGRIGRQTPIVYGQVGRQTPSRGFADILARAQAADADALANPVIPSKRGSASASDFLSLMDDAPAGNTVSPAVAKATAEETRRSAFLKLRDLMQADVNGGAKMFNSADLRARVQKELGLPDNDPVLGQINSKSVSRTADIIRKNMEGKAQIISNTADAAQDLAEVPPGGIQAKPNLPVPTREKPIVPVTPVDPAEVARKNISAAMYAVIKDEVSTNPNPQNTIRIRNLVAQRLGIDPSNPVIDEVVQDKTVRAATNKVKKELGIKGQKKPVDPKAQAAMDEKAELDRRIHGQGNLPGQVFIDQTGDDPMLRQGKRTTHERLDMLPTDEQADPRIREADRLVSQMRAREVAARGVTLPDGTAVPMEPRPKTALAEAKAAMAKDARKAEPGPLQKAAYDSWIADAVKRMKANDLSTTGGRKIAMSEAELRRQMPIQTWLKATNDGEKGMSLSLVDDLKALRRAKSAPEAVAIMRSMVRAELNSLSDEALEGIAVMKSRAHEAFEQIKSTMPSKWRRFFIGTEQQRTAVGNQKFQAKGQLADDMDARQLDISKEAADMLLARKRTAPQVPPEGSVVTYEHDRSMLKDAPKPVAGDPGYVKPAPVDPATVEPYVEPPDPRDAELYRPDTTPNGGGQDVDINGKNRPTVDAKLKNPPKPAFTAKDRLRINTILDDILPLQRMKDVPFRRAIAEAADAMRQRSMKMLDIPEEIRPWAEKLNEAFDKPRSKKGNGQLPSGQAAGRELTSDLDLAPEDDLLVNSGERRLSAQEIRELEDVTPSLGEEGFRRAETDAGLGVTFGGIPFPEIDPDSMAGKALHATKKWLWEPLSNLPVALQRSFRHWEDRQAVLRSDIYAVGRELRKYRNEAGFDNARLKELWTKGGDATVDALRERYARVVTPVLKRAEEMGLLKKGSSDPFHMPRLYRVFEEHGFVPADELWEPAAASLVKSGVAKDADEAMEILGDLVNARNQGRDGAHKAAATLDRAMKLKDVPEELRLFLGEMDDPVYAMWKNAVDWSRDVETLALAHNLVAQGKGDWVSDKPVKGWIKWDDRWLQAWASGTGLPISKTGSLSKMWVHPDVAEPLIRSHREASDLAKAWRVGMSLFKMAKVPLSPATQMVNVIGNSWLASLGGMNIFKQGEALPGALEMVINSRRGVDSDWVKMAKEAGVIGKHFMAGDLDLLADGFKETMKIKKGSAPLKAMLALREMVDRSPLAKPGEWYGMLEDSYRLMLFKHYMTEGMDAPMFSRASAFLKKTMPSADEAAEEVNRVLFDYTRVPKAVDAMRNTAWPFITFPYKYATSVGRMVVKNPPRLFAHIMGAAFLVNELKKNGYDVNVSRFIPGMGVLFPEEYEREKSPAARVLDVLKPGGPAVLPYELAAGKSVFTGGDIYYDDDTTGERIKKGAVHTFRTLAPTLLGYTGKKLLQAWDDTFNNGQPENRARRDFTRELVEAVTGVRVTPRTQEQWTNKQRTIYGRMRSEQARFGAWMRANPNAAEGEVADRQARLQKSLLKLWQRWDELEEEKKGLPSR